MASEELFHSDTSYADKCLDWDSAIESDEPEYLILPEGDYNFTVIDFERGRFPGSAKTPPCNKAIVTVAVRMGTEVVHVRFDLIMFKSWEWKLSAFFRCIGQKRLGETLVMNWNTVRGSRGRAHFKPRTYTNRNDQERTVNDLDSFIDYDEKFFANEQPVQFVELDSDEELPF